MSPYIKMHQSTLQKKRTIHKLDQSTLQKKRTNQLFSGICANYAYLIMARRGLNWLITETIYEAIWTGYQIKRNITMYKLNYRVISAWISSSERPRVSGTIFSTNRMPKPEIIEYMKNTPVIKVEN